MGIGLKYSEMPNLIIDFLMLPNPPDYLLSEIFVPNYVVLK